MDHTTNYGKRIGCILLRKKDLLFVFPFVPVFGNVASLYVSCIWSDYRYGWSGMMLGTILFLYVIAALSRISMVE